MSARDRKAIGAILRRSLIHTFTNPTIILPATLFPMIFLVAFAGGLSTVGDVPGFDYPPGYTTFQYVFVVIQTAAFSGLFTGFAIAVDFQSGFQRRLMLAVPSRTNILIAYGIAGTIRFLITGTLITAAALLAGMNVEGSVFQFAALIALGILVNIACMLWSSGLAFRFKSIVIGSFMQTPVFTLLFLAPVYVPVALLTGWIKPVAQLNPVTAFFNAGRGFLAGAPQDTVLAFACAFGLVGVMAVWALTGLRRAERGV